MWRMSLPTLVVSLLLLAVGLVAGAYLYRLNSQLSEELDRGVTTVLMSEELLLAMRDTRNAMGQFGRGMRESINDAKESFAGAERLIKQLETFPQDERLVATVKERMADVAAFIARSTELTTDEY